MIYFLNNKDNDFFLIKIKSYNKKQIKLIGL